MESSKELNWHSNNRKLKPLGKGSWGTFLTDKSGDVT